MSSAANITFEKDTIGVPADEWKSFCAEHHIEYSPQTVGGNVYYQGSIEVHYAVHELRFCTFWMSGAIPGVARLAKIAWKRWGGYLSADPEVRAAMYNEAPP